MDLQTNISYKKRIFWFFPVLFCFCLPFGSLLLSGMIVLWTLSSFLVVEKQQFLKGVKSPWFILLTGFLLLTAFSALFSLNREEALFNIENKLSFILFPYLIFCFDWSPQILKKCVTSFVSGCFFACLFLIVRAFYFYSQGNPDSFFYNQFSYFVHPSSFSMYLILAVCLASIYYPQWFGAVKMYTYITYIYVALFCVTIFLNSSKIGLISAFICFPILIFYKWREKLNLKMGLALVAGIILLLFVSIKLFPGPFERFEAVLHFSSANIDKTSSESTTVRYLIWEQCIEIIKNNFFFGVSVGDVTDVLVKAYQQNGMTGALEHRLNAHSQFFQTFVGLGFIGFVLLFGFTFFALIRAFVKKNIILSIFLIYIILNFSVESMLQRSDGTLFFVFFFCFFNREKIYEELA